MDEKMMEISFGIIGFSGEAKGIAKEAINASKSGDIKKAHELLQEASATLNNAHRFQTELITNEANGNKTDMSVVLVHSQDHLMTTMSYIDLASEFVSMYEFLHNK